MDARRTAGGNRLHSVGAGGGNAIYVWTKGTDPELILLVECRRIDGEAAWCFAPARLTNRGVWLKRAEKDVWGVHGHEEPAGKVTTLVYTTAFARSMPEIKKAEAGGK